MVSVVVGAIFGNDKEFEYNFLIISRYLNLNEKKGTNLDKLCVISSMLSLFITLYRQCLLQKFPSHAKFNEKHNFFS
jgi:hypothetical protein